MVIKDIYQSTIYYHLIQSMYHGTTIFCTGILDTTSLHTEPQSPQQLEQSKHMKRERERGRQGKLLGVRVKGVLRVVLVGPDPPEPHPHPQLLSFHLLSLTHTSHIIKTFAAELIERQIKNKLRKMRWRMPARTS